MSKHTKNLGDLSQSAAANERQSPKSNLTNTIASSPLTANMDNSAMVKNSSTPPDSSSTTPPEKNTKTSLQSAAITATSPNEKVSPSPIIKLKEEVWPYFPDWEGDLHSEYINSLPNICEIGRAHV